MVLCHTLYYNRLLIPKVPVLERHPRRSEELEREAGRNDIASAEWSGKLMMTLRLIPLGVGEAFTAHHYTSCLALGADDDWMLIDCPHPVRKMLVEGSNAAGFPLDLDRISAVAVSHLHADHCCGLEDFGYYSFFALGRRARCSCIPRSRPGSGAACSPGAWSFSQASPATPPVRKQLADYFELIDLDEVPARDLRTVFDRVPADDPRRADDGLSHPWPAAELLASAPIRPMTPP